MYCRDCPALTAFSSYNQYTSGFGFQCDIMLEPVFYISFDEAKLLGIETLKRPNPFDVWGEDQEAVDFWYPYLKIPCICSINDFNATIDARMCSVEDGVKDVMRRVKRVAAWKRELDTYKMAREMYESN